MLSVPPAMKTKHCDSPQSASNVVPMIKASKKQAKPRVFDENQLNGNQTPNLQPLNEYFTDTKRQSNGSLTAAFYLIRDLLNQPEVAEKAVAQHGEEANSVLTGALCIAKHILPGHPVSSGQIIKGCATEYPQFSIRMLTDKSKPVLIELGVLVKINAIKYRWADINELNQCLNPVDPQDEQQNVDRKAPVQALKKAGSHLQNVIDAYQRKKAASDPWSELLPDGSIKKHRKEFTGQYTTEEKQAIRDAFKRNSYAKLLSKSPALTPEAKQLAEQKQLEMIERKAAMAAQMDTLKMWAKIIGFLLVVWFVVGTFGNKPVQPVNPMLDDSAFLPNGIHGGVE